MKYLACHKESGRGLSIVYKHIHVFFDSGCISGFRSNYVCPTHQSGHTLDLVITCQSDSCLVGDICASHDLMSDHVGLVCPIRLGKPAANKKIITSRKFRHIDVAVFVSDVEAKLCAFQPASLDDLVSNYNCTLQHTLNNRAPISTRTVTDRPHSPWFNQELRDAKTKRRTLERKWKSSSLVVNYQIYREQCKLYIAMIHRSSGQNGTIIARK